MSRNSTGPSRRDIAVSVRSVQKKVRTMKPRIDYRKTAPDGISALSALENYVRQSGLEPALLELVKLRAS